MVDGIKLVYTKKLYILISAISGSLLLLLYYYLMEIGYLFYPLLFNTIIVGKIFDIIGFSVISVLFAISLSMIVYSIREYRGKKHSSQTATAMIAGIFTQMLCCTPIVGSLLAILGASTTTILGTTGIIQGTFAELEPILIIVSIALLVLSIKTNSNSILNCKLKQKRV